MKSDRLMGLATTLFIRSAPVLALCLGAAAALAYGVHWHQANARRGRAPFDVVATPGSRSVTAGGTVKYKIAIHRRHYRGRIRLSVVSRTSQFASTSQGGRVKLAIHGQTATLIVKTVGSATAGSYSVKVKAVGGRYRGYLILKLKVAAPQPASFQIGGNFGPLWPGTAQAVNLALTNPNGQSISIQSLIVAVKKVAAPRATNILPCSAADFAVVQFAGPYPLKIPAHGTVHLSDLGVAAARGPQLRMLNRPVNQDGCRAATVTLSYTGTATSP